MNDTELLACLVIAVAESHCTNAVCNRIANEAFRRHVAGETGAALDLGELSHTLRATAIRMDERKTEEEVVAEYAELARERAELRKLARPSLTLAGKAN